MYLAKANPNLRRQARSVTVTAHQLIRRQTQHLKAFSTTANDVVRLTRSYLYVPASSDHMLEKSISCNADVILYDLEDSVAPSAKDKGAARARLRKFLEVLLLEFMQTTKNPTLIFF